MNQNIGSFMQAVLGDTAAEALRKATERVEPLESVLGPRVVVGWLGFVSQWSYNGTIPGVPESTLTFQKNQSTDLFDGSFGVGNEVYDFQNASLTHLAATLSVALGVDQPVDKSLKDTDLVGLGKNIDLLVKSRVIQLAKQEKSFCCEKACNDCGACPVHLAGKSEFKHGGKCLEKGQQDPAQSGTQAAPRAPEAPGAPDPQRKQPAMRQPPKPKLNITKSQSESRCSVCDAASFSKGQFTGCFCFRELAKHAQTLETANGYLVTFGPEWTKSNLRILMDILGSGNEAVS